MGTDQTIRYYTGVGSRSTPNNVIETVWMAAQAMAEAGVVLRSGAANGADTFWEIGCDRAGGQKEIYLPWDGFNGHDSPLFLQSFPVALQAKAFEIAKSVHPVLEALRDSIQLLHTRNVFQVLGRDLATPSERVICWTPNGATMGGTATAIRVAEMYGIPVANLAKEAFKL